MLNGVAGQQMSQDQRLFLSSDGPAMKGGVLPGSEKPFLERLRLIAKG